MKLYQVLLLAFPLFIACDDDSDTGGSDPANSDIPAVYQKIYGATDMYLDGDFIIIKTEGRPDHKSPYYQGTAYETDLYEAYNGNNPDWHKNPNTISALDATYRIPLNPTASRTTTPTGLGSIGVSLNGVAFFNQYAGPNNQPLTNEINSFDQYAGHPQNTGVYHYHLEPVFLTANSGQEALMGFLLDGFPVYGPMEDGMMVEESDLDAFHGHKHATDDFPDGIYHYHITDQDPYINGSGYYGTPGTVTF